MSHKLITLSHYSLILPHKTCFEDFGTTIYSGSKIAITGRNGSGKSSLLQMIIKGLPQEINYGYVPQIVANYQEYSGAQRFNKALTAALATHPEILLLDEPTNHLDARNRKSLMRMLKNFAGSLIIVTHDLEILRNLAEIIWHIDQGKISVFTGNYDDYLYEANVKINNLHAELTRLDMQKKEAHQKLMKEQMRAKNSKAQGAKNIQDRKWPTIISNVKATRGEETSGRKKSSISHLKQDIIDKLSQVRLPEVIKPNFKLTTSDLSCKAIVEVVSASVGYQGGAILSNINLSVTGTERIAITGDNGSGKSTIIKAILGQTSVTKTGNWYIPAAKDIGYLDQHYDNLSNEQTVFSVIQDAVPTWTNAAIRKHLNNFLFRKNEEIQTKVGQLSGGEKCRLSLAFIAAISPKLLLFDEITNNLDLETKEHVIQVLNDYPGAMIIISHDEEFLRGVNIQSYYDVKDFAK
jgi:ATPase subunit of ABC transporter with duplicated ATPase domains